MKRSAELSKLISLARIARKKVEALAQVERGPYHLMGYCGVASRYLELIANQEKLSPAFVSGEFMAYNRIIDVYGLVSGHSWLELDGYIIDITATQFKNVISKVDRDFNQKVYVCRTSNPHYKTISYGDDAKRQVGTWYVEPLEEICQKIDMIVKTT